MISFEKGESYAIPIEVLKQGLYEAIMNEPRKDWIIALFEYYILEKTPDTIAETLNSMFSEKYRKKISSGDIIAAAYMGGFLAKGLIFASHYISNAVGRFLITEKGYHVSGTDKYDFISDTNELVELKIRRRTEIPGLGYFSTEMLEMVKTGLKGKLLMLVITKKNGKSQVTMHQYRLVKTESIIV